MRSWFIVSCTSNNYEWVCLYACVQSGIRNGSILSFWRPISYSARLNRLNFDPAHFSVAKERLSFLFRRRTDLISSAFLRSLECACPSLQLRLFSFIGALLDQLSSSLRFRGAIFFFRLQVVHWNCWLQKRQHCVFCKCGRYVRGVLKKT